MALDHLFREQGDDLLLEDGGWILLESASDPSFRARIEDFSGVLVSCLEASGQSVKFEDGSEAVVRWADFSEGWQ